MEVFSVKCIFSYNFLYSSLKIHERKEAYKCILYFEQHISFYTLDKHLINNKVY